MPVRARRLDDDELLAPILDVDLETCNIDLCFASVDQADVPDFQCVSISKEVVEDFRRFAQKALKWVQNAAGEGENVLRAYTADWKPDGHEIEYFDLAKQDSIRKQIHALADSADIDNFVAEETFISHLRFYVTVFRPKKGQPIMFFRLCGPKSELTRSRKLALMLKKGNYDRLTEKTFLFDDKVDCIVRGNSLIILNKDKFQKIFRFYEELLRTAEATLTIIEKHVKIDDFEAFRESCEGHLQKLGKLKNIAGKPYLEKLSMEKVKDMAAGFRLKIATVGKGKGEKIRFAESDTWDILKLFDDDFLKSDMTELQYEVNSKRTR